MPLPSRIAVFLLVIILAAGCIAGRHPGLNALEIAAPLHLLSNGTAIIVQEHHGADVVSVQLWVRAGARDETESGRGRPATVVLNLPS